MNIERKELANTERGKHLTRLQPGDVVEIDGREHRVHMVNDCRAYCIPLEKITREITPATGVNAGKKVDFKATPPGVSISPNSSIPIIRRIK